MTDDKKEDTRTGGAYINLILNVLLQDNDVVIFKIKKLTPFRKLMSAYCNEAGLPATLVRFRFDGQPVNENDTPNSLEMKEGDVIEVYMGQIGGRD